MSARKQVWFLTGSQELYGEVILAQVQEQSRRVSDVLAASAQVVVDIVPKPVMTSADAIRRTMLAANADDECVGVITWMHTFSPAKLWIKGLDQLTKPLLHFHTQANAELPWSTIDMGFMNLNQAAHGDREYAFIATRLGKRRTTVAGHVSSPRVQDRIGAWTRAAVAADALRHLKVARFGDNMRYVAVTEGDKVEAEIDYGVEVNTWSANDLAAVVDAVEDRAVDQTIEEYLDLYDVAPELLPGAERADSLRVAARIELDDFWTKPGYLGTEQSDLGDFFRAALSADPGARARLAMMVYHRYTIPAAADLHAYDQFRAADGTPLYPQRPLNVASILTRSISGGATFSGIYSGKMIMLASVLDADAYAWPAAWYASRAKAALGTAYAGSFRLWYTDNADHNPYTPTDAQASRLVGYVPVVFRALRSVADWVERGVVPEQSTQYSVSADNAVTLPTDATDRAGVQAVVHLTAVEKGREGRKPSCTVGSKVLFRAEIQVPPGAGSIVSVAWDFDGDGTFEETRIQPGRTRLVVTGVHRYGAAGTYYPSVRVSSQDHKTNLGALTAVQNLDRIAVTVNR